jgi:hypothetical protein
MKSMCITKERGQLMQVECKWCNELKRNNFKDKLYTTHNLWDETPLPSVSHIMVVYYP